jgi:hypothetical protein
VNFTSPRGFSQWVFYHGTKFRSAVDFLRGLGYTVTTTSEVIK